MIHSVKGLVLTKLNPRHNNLFTALIEMAQKSKRLRNKLPPPTNLNLLNIANSLIRFTEIYLYRPIPASTHHLMKKRGKTLLYWVLKVRFKAIYRFDKILKSSVIIQQMWRKNPPCKENDHCENILVITSTVNYRDYIDLRIPSIAIYFF